jgi:dolichol-phosphate mannosyltransferase
VTADQLRGIAPVVSVVVPTRNEASNIQPLVDRVTAALAGTRFEICFVDDSDDATPDLLLELCQAQPPVQLARAKPTIRCLLRQGADRRGGLSTAVVAGMRMARGRYVCVMDADLQHPPELVPVMLAEAERGADLVVASRYAPGGSREGLDGSTRRLVSRGATVVARLLFTEARQSSDPLSGFFLCRRALVDGIEFRPVGFKILLELLVCVPELRVVDVPMTQAPRSAGESKATSRQGLLYLRHLWSLFFDVPGSARVWKFGLVGLSGLCVFLPILAILIGIAGVQPLIAFIPAFGLSAAWNTAMNWRLTFGDQRRGGHGPRHYLEFALLSGCVMFGVFALLINAQVASVVAGLAAAVVAMLINGLVNRALIHRGPAVWAAIAIDQGVQGSLSRLAEDVGADRAYLLPARGESSGLPTGLLAHVIAHKRPVLITEAASHRAQRRTNIETVSRMLLPVVRDDIVLAVVVCERVAPGGFDPAALEIATVAVEAIEPALIAAAAVPPQRPEVAPARAAPGPAR